MNKTVSNESLTLLTVGGAMAATAVSQQLIKHAPAIASWITSRAAGALVSTGVGAAKQVAKNASEGSDLVRFTQSARVEPILLMDKAAANIPFIQDVVHTAFNMFTGYWLLAVSLDAKINNVSVGRRLDKFATDRNLADATYTMLTSSMESARISSESFGLPFVGEMIDAEEKASLEALSIDDGLDGSGDKKEGKPGAKLSVANAAKTVEKITNMAVGHVVDVTISEDDKSVVVPVTIRLRVAGMPSSVMAQTLAVGGKDVTFGSRWRAWRAGEIKFWADFVLAMDRVDAHRAAMMKDETGYYKAVYSRASKNNMAGLMAQGPSLATASSIIVLTEETARELERKTGSELKNFKSRQGIFGHTFSMLMIVVDPDWESVTIYTRGIEMPTKLTAKDIKTASKSDSKEVMDILKSYQLGRAPGRF